MQRCELASTVLQLKAMGIDNIMKFEWLAPPPAETMVRALELLHALGALGDDARQACCPHIAYPPALPALCIVDPRQGFTPCTAYPCIAYPCIAYPLHCVTCRSD